MLSAYALFTLSMLLATSSQVIRQLLVFMHTVSKDVQQAAANTLANFPEFAG